MSLTGHHLADTPVAIVGLGGLYPRSADLGQFWSNIVRGEDCITDVPASHWDPQDYFDPDPTMPDKIYCTRGGFIPSVPFDPIEWGMPPSVIGVTDVLQLLSLGVAKATLEDAGAPGSDWYDSSRTGVVLGITGANSLTQPLSTRLQTPTLRRVVEACGLDEQTVDYITDTFVKAYAPWEENSFPGMLGNVVAGRVANRLDLGGVNCTVDAACASSLAAVRTAVDELVLGRADLMLTGGCDAENTILMYMCFSKTPALSRSGLIRPFDKENDGTLIGEGTGMIALKRLEDAERDGDRIYAVLRGMGSSSDGRYKSIYAPRKEGQVVALRRAYDDARLDPGEIGLIECHGTGTAVGDRTELESLAEVFTVSDTPSHAAVGSVKSQIGHTKAAAGAASLIKAALALHQKVMPPTINVTDPTDAANGPKSPFHVGTRARPWVVEPDRPSRAAAVSSFGFGGTNFHVVLTEHGDDVEAPLEKRIAVAFWTAEDRAGLLEAMDAEPTGSAWTAPGTARAAVVGTAEEIEVWRERLSAAIRDSETDAIDLPAGWFRLGTASGRAAALFAGQGSQYVGMGAFAALRHPVIRRAFDEASLASPSYDPLSRHIFPPHPFDDAEAQSQDSQLRRTDRAQAALAAITVGQYRFLSELGFAPAAGLGHSFGELSALWAAGSIDTAALHRLAQARGQAMADRPEHLDDLGTMAAIGASADDVRAEVDSLDDVWICNLNGPAQTVIGGASDSVDAFVTRAESRGWTARRLPVGAAFHTPLIHHAIERFGANLVDETIGSPEFPVLSCTEDAEYGEDPDLNRAVLGQQLAEPVQFEGRVRELYESGIRVFIEFGPRSVLGGLVEQILADADDVTVLSADAGPRGDSERSLSALVARLAVLGFSLSDPQMDLDPATNIDQKNGMTIMLDGTNYQPDDRVSEFEAALNASPTVADGTTSSPTSAPAPRAADRDLISEVADEHLAMHRTYLGSQLKVAERLAHILESDSRIGRDWELAVDAMRAVADQSTAIGHSHAVAADVIRSFVGDDSGHAAVVPNRSHPKPSVRSNDLELPSAPTTSSSGSTVASPETAPASAGLVDEIVVDEPQAATVQKVSDDQTSTPTSSATSAPDSDDVIETESVSDVLLGIVAEKTGYPADMLDPEMDLEADLGIDSIKRVEIMSALRDRVPSSDSADPETMGGMRTLSEIGEYLTGSSAVNSDPKVI
ncbi:MAG: beta-ketoacyl synthase N-terminal-like domain-containing protein [Brevibacterium sp.]|uniref:beta-ketoacyl synthase N-terminal-like domain-containing protein n=1 Tax=Brevibacterium TaxID=1696 RepID=UPI003F8D9B28